jgi:hypothetical protein
VPVAGEDLNLTAIEMDLGPVTVVFDFVNQWSPDGAFIFSVASWGLMKPGIFDLTILDAKLI